ncbi:hypothetical protein PROFUN_06209 [Planoprotostelium fungivorum]|uniref:Uncharacterized protein n=1 Tax=Planoprotostelium fungivorum TaxID=1890364 RepID=A0A2P6MZ01_9EUKA|nr:hypothetical protein PROFUN_06209 [Planoprotostelium fungivorum]
MSGAYTSPFADFVPPPPSTPSSVVSSFSSAPSIPFDDAPPPPPPDSPTFDDFEEKPTFKILLPSMTANVARVEPKVEDTERDDSMALDLHPFLKRDRSDRKRSDKKQKKDKKHKKSKKNKKQKTDQEKIIAIEQKLAKEGRRKPPSVWLTKDRIVEQPYFYDMLGDPNNAVYGELYRNDVPVYRRGRRCIGLPENEVIRPTRICYLFSTRGSRENSGTSKGRYLDRQNIAKERDVELKRVNLKAIKRQDAGTLDGDFIKLDVERVEKKKEAREENETYSPTMESSESEDEDYADYLERVDNSEDEDEEKERKEDEGESLEEWVTRRTRQLNAATRERPDELKVWLDFIQFQTKLSDMGFAGREKLSGLLEKKISIYQKALEYHPDSVQLMLGLVREGKALWTVEKTEQVWTAILQQARPQNVVEIWIEYLRHSRSSFQLFSITRWRERVARAIAVITNVEADSRTDEHRLEMETLRLLVETAYMERAAGYRERGIAIFQAAIEFNLFTPSHISSGNLRRNFEKFWESEVPRGAMGWNQWNEGDSDQTIDPKHSRPVRPPKKPEVYSVPLPPSRLNPQEELENMDQQMEEDLSTMDPESLSAEKLRAAQREVQAKRDLLKWMNEEEEKEKSQKFPCRPLVGFGISEEEEITDPDRVIIFDDIRPFLHFFELKETRMSLVDHFLCFMGLSLPNSSTGERLKRPGEPSVGSVMPLYSTEIQSLFDEIRIPTDMKGNTDRESWRSYSPLPDPLDARCVENIFYQTRKLFPSDRRLLMNQLQFFTIQSPNLAADVIKAEMSKNRNDLLLFDAYARVKRKTGSLEEARKVYNGALSLSHALPPASRSAHVILLRNFAEMEMEAGHSQASTFVLTSICDETFSPLSSTTPQVPKTKIPKARKLWSDRSQKVSEEADGDEKVSTFVCHGLMEYLTGGIQACIHAFESCEKFLGKSSIQLEEYVFYCGILTDTIYLQRFPVNGYFLSVFIESEARSQIAGRIRSHFDDVCDRLNSPLLWMMSIHTETTRLGGSHRVRSLFDRALHDASCRSCPALWRYFIQFEAQRGKLEGAKAAFYRAIQEVPWAKPVWKDLFTVLQSRATSDELRDAIKLMTEKEVRLMVPPDEE